MKIFLSIILIFISFTSFAANKELKSDSVLQITPEKSLFYLHPNVVKKFKWTITNKGNVPLEYLFLTFNGGNINLTPLDHNCWLPSLAPGKSCETYVGTNDLVQLKDTGSFSYTVTAIYGKEVLTVNQSSNFSNLAFSTTTKNNPYILSNLDSNDYTIENIADFNLINLDIALNNSSTIPFTVDTSNCQSKELRPNDTCLIHITPTDKTTNGKLTIAVLGTDKNGKVYKATNDFIYYANSSTNKIPDPVDIIQQKNHDNFERFFVTNLLKNGIKYYITNGNNYENMQTLSNGSENTVAVDAWSDNNPKKALTFLITGNGKDAGKTLVLATREIQFGHSDDTMDGKIEFYFANSTGLWNYTDPTIPFDALYDTHVWTNVFPGKEILLQRIKQMMSHFNAADLNFYANEKGNLVISVTSAEDHNHPQVDPSCLQPDRVGTCLTTSPQEKTFDFQVN